MLVAEVQALSTRSASPAPKPGVKREDGSRKRIVSKICDFDLTLYFIVNLVDNVLRQCKKLFAVDTIQTN